MNVNLEKSLSSLGLDKDIIVILEEKNINKIKDLWNLNRKDLKKYNFDDKQINHIIIKMQLSGLDLNHKIYY